jgi:beta-lactamase regulating signal transducer with metallopeptidase domain
VETLLRVALSNALAAGVLALAAGVVARCCRRPALVHSLWLLVLLKLLTPPLVTVPLPWPAPAETATLPELAPDTPARGDAADPLPVEGDEEVLAALLAVAADEPVPAEPSSAVTATAGLALSWTTLVPVLWAMGSASWIGLAVWRLWRFGRLLRFARPAPRWLRKQAGDIAARLGLGGCPQVLLVPGQISPMLWAVAGPVQLLLPADLLDRLSRDQRAALLAHELAHLRRRDHWVRRLEFVVSALYWWHPVVWWACRELREAEEQCCDAWVVWALPGIRRAYALTLVETVDFLSEARAALPVLASGVGHVDNLRRRVTMIMQGATPRTLTWGGGLTVFGLALFLLPLLPDWARSQPPRDEKPARATEDKVELKLTGQLARVEEEDDRADIKKLEAEIVELHKRLQDAEERLKRAHARGANAAGREGPKKMILLIEGPDGKERRIELPDGAGVGVRGEGRLIIRDEKAEGDRAKVEMRRTEVGDKVEIRKPDGGEMRGRIIINRGEGDGPMVPPPPPGSPARGRSPADLERKLDEIIREIDELRRELKRQPGPGAPAPRGPGRSGEEGSRFAPPAPPLPATAALPTIPPVTPAAPAVPPVPPLPAAAALPPAPPVAPAAPVVPPSTPR